MSPLVLCREQLLRWLWSITGVLVVLSAAVNAAHGGAIGIVVHTKAKP
jgi:hypothetical protein